MPACYTRREAPAGNDYAGSYSAYCARCQPVDDECDFGSGLKACHCARCNEAFTAVEAFDLHQRVSDDGVTCLDPQVMTRKDGSPMFARQGQLWARNRPGRKAREWPARTGGRAADGREARPEGTACPPCLRPLKRL